MGRNINMFSINFQICVSSGRQRHLQPDQDRHLEDGRAKERLGWERGRRKGSHKHCLFVCLFWGAIIVSHHNSWAQTSGLKRLVCTVWSPEVLQCGEPRSRLETSLGLGTPPRWEMKLSKPWRCSAVIFVARGPGSLANDFRREPDIFLIFEYFFFLVKFHFPTPIPQKN